MLVVRLGFTLKTVLLHTLINAEKWSPICTSGIASCGSMSGYRANRGLSSPHQHLKPLKAEYCHTIASVVDVSQHYYVHANAQTWLACHS